MGGWGTLAQRTSPTCQTGLDDVYLYKMVICKSTSGRILGKIYHWLRPPRFTKTWSTMLAHPPTHQAESKPTWQVAHCSPWCKKRGGFWWSNFKKWETLRSSFHKLRTSLFHCRVQNRGPESARDLFSLTQDLTFLNYWHRNRGPEFTHAFFSTLNGTKEANTSLMPFLDSRLKIPQWKEIIHYDSHEEKALPSCES